jgi:hypothetical protein
MATDNGKCLMNRQISLFLAALLMTGSAAVANDLIDNWLIRPGDGIGRIHGKVTYARARELYPKVVLTVEDAYIGFRVPPNSNSSRDYPTENYFVFRENGEELFRAECVCKPTQVKEGDGAWKHEIGDGPDKKIIHPVTVNPRFHTKEGIHVGSTIGELRHAYHDAPMLVAIRGFAEYACFGPSPNSLKWEEKPSVTKVAFYLNPAPGKDYAGKYVGHDFTKVIDDDAVIVAIDPRGGCSLPEEGGEE